MWGWGLGAESEGQCETGVGWGRSNFISLLIEVLRKMTLAAEWSSKGGHDRKLDDRLGTTAVLFHNRGPVRVIS